MTHCFGNFIRIGEQNCSQMAASIQFIKFAAEPSSEYRNQVGKKSLLDVRRTRRLMTFHRRGMDHDGTTITADRLLGVTIRTLQRWDVEGKLKTRRTPTGRRFYTDEDIQRYRGSLARPIERVALVYTRVSSQAQKPDLKNQKLRLEEFCIGKSLAVDEWIEEIGGGLNFKRPKFVKLFDRVIAGEVKQLVIAHKDRLARFGFDFLKHLCSAHQCELIVMNTESLSPEREMVEDLMAITHCFSARSYGLRNYKKPLKQALKDDQSS
jgi:putative resolvase